MAKTSSPRFEAGWTQLREALPLALRGNAAWQKVASRFLDEVEIKDPTATVSISLYNPTNLLLTLYWIAWNQDFSKCPQLEILVENPAAGTVRALVGILAWDGCNVQDALFC